MNGHECHRTGCHAQIPPQIFMCRRDWFLLPRSMREAIWTTYRPGQEITKDPSPAYLEAAQAAIDYLGPRVRELAP